MYYLVHSNHLYASATFDKERLAMRLYDRLVSHGYTASVEKVYKDGHSVVIVKHIVDSYVTQAV